MPPALNLSYELERSPEIQRQITLWQQLEAERSQLIANHKRYLDFLYSATLDPALFAPSLVFPVAVPDFSPFPNRSRNPQVAPQEHSYYKADYDAKRIAMLNDSWAAYKDPPFVSETPNWMVPYFKQKRMRFNKEDGAASISSDNVLPSSSWSTSRSVYEPPTEDEKKTQYFGGTAPVFTLFPRLPFELRAKIWESCIEPQVLDIWSHYYHKSTIITVENDPAKVEPSQSNLARYPTSASPDSRVTSREHDTLVEHGLFIITPQRIPILHICRESRALAQSKGMMIFNSNRPDIELVAPNITWPYMGPGYEDMRPSKWELFDPANDVYFIHCSEDHRKSRPVHRNICNIIQLLGWVKNTIRHLALTLADFSTLVIASSGRRLGQELPGDWAWLAEFPNLEDILVIDGEQAGLRARTAGKEHLKERITKMQQSWYDSENGLRKDTYRDKWKMPILRYVDDRTILEQGLGRSLQIKNVPAFKAFLSDSKGNVRFLAQSIDCCHPSTFVCTSCLFHESPWSTES